MMGLGDLESRLVATGREPVDPWAGLLAVESGMSFEGFGAAISFEQLLSSTIAEDGRRDVSMGAFFGIFRYELLSSGPIGLEPMLGLGSVMTTVCSLGRPEDPVAPAGDEFEQLVGSPGPELCLDASAAAVRVGMTVRYRVWIDVGADERFGLRFGLSPAFTAPFGGATWTTDEPGVPDFDGPTALAAGPSLRFEIGIAYGYGRRGQ
jgi:hypothetical protein